MEELEADLEEAGGAGAGPRLGSSCLAFEGVYTKKTKREAKEKERR